MTIKEAITTVIKTSQTAEAEAARQAARKLTNDLFPAYEAMSEDELRVVLDPFEAARSIKHCPYSREKFHSEQPKFAMIEADGSLAVGVELFMRLRALRDGVPCFELGVVYSALNSKHEELRTAREAEEARLAELEQQRIAIVMKVAEVGTMLDRLNEVDKLDMMPKVFDQKLIEIAHAEKITDDELTIYFEERERQRKEAESALTQAAEGIGPETTAEAYLCDGVEAAIRSTHEAVDPQVAARVLEAEDSSEITGY